MSVGGDPVEAGLVTSLNRPGGNVTGVSFTANLDLTPKRLELLHELVPKPAVIALLWDPNGREVEAELRDLEAAAARSGGKSRSCKPEPKAKSMPAFATMVASGRWRAVRRQ